MCVCNWMGGSQFTHNCFIELFKLCFIWRVTDVIQSIVIIIGKAFFCWKTGKVVACEVCGRLYLLPSSLHGDGCRISFLSGLFTQSKVFLILCKSYSPWSTGLDAPAHRQVGRTVCGDCWQRRGVPKLSVQYVYGKSGGSVFYDKLPTPLKKWPADHHSVRMWDG